MIVRCLYYLLFLKLSISHSNDDLTVDYYVKVIQEGEAEALAYPYIKDASQYKPASSKTTEFGTYDYIIVGAGAAGSIIATRLSEDRHLKILLLEAGDQENSFTDILSEKLYLEGTKYNWGYYTVPQTTWGFGMVNRTSPIPTGKAIGGSTVINANIYVRGNRKDYDKWASLGNPGWSYEDVLPYFIKSENSQIDGDPGYHGVGGPLNVQYHRPYSPQFYAFIDANLELGRKVVDYNGREQLGVGRAQLNVLDGRRLSVARAFLAYAWNRNNLKVLKNSYVTKILIDKQRKEAYGVQFSHNKRLYIARASKEVVVSAGSFGSPHLLMLSGIGPAAHLNELNIPVVQNLPVGQNLQDHATFYGLLYSTNYTEPIKPLPEYVEEFLHGSGPLTIADDSQGLAFLQTKLMKTPGVPDIEIMLSPANATNRFTQRALHYTDDTYNAVYGNVNPANMFKHYLILLHPKSQGSVKLKSTDPYDYPLIDPRFLSDSKNIDIETFYQGIQLSLEMINTKAFKKLDTRLINTAVPACRKYEYLSRDYWYCQIRHLTMHIYHPIGTCKMGPNPSDSVVDHNLRVHGIKRLRVADASVFPYTTSGHTAAPAMMLGEKASDMLRNKSIKADCLEYQ